MSDMKHDEHLDEHLTVRADDYEVTLHPAFASRCCVTPVGGAETELYKQEGVHHLNGKSHPKKHKLRVKGGPHGRDFELTVSDPKHHVAKIVIELYDGSRSVISPEKARVTETVSLMNDGLTCPPYCGAPGGRFR